MSPTGFISELVRAANQVDHLTAIEKRRLLERAVVTILEMRDEVGIPPSRAARDAVIDLQTTAAEMERRTDEHVRAALLTREGSKTAKRQSGRLSRYWCATAGSQVGRTMT